MAHYKYASCVAHLDNPAFDQLFHAGAHTLYSGIYRCEVCGYEATSVAGHTLPPHDHHPHNLGAGPIMWRLIVAAVHR